MGTWDVSYRVWGFNGGKTQGLKPLLAWLRQAKGQQGRMQVRGLGFTVPGWGMQRMAAVSQSSDDGLTSKRLSGICLSIDEIGHHRTD